MSDKITAEKLKAVYDNSEKAKALNTELESILYGADTGGKSFYDKFWDACQQNGNRTNYQYAFQYGSWHSANFYPKYDIKPTGDAQGMFRGICWDSWTPFNLKTRLEYCGVKLDLSKVTSFAYGFNSAKITVFPELDFTGLTATSGQAVFQYCDATTTFEKIKIKETTYITGWFTSCTALTNIVFDGEIGRSVSFSSSTKLTLESAINIITHLKDYSSDTTNAYKYTLTFSSKTIALLEAEGNASPNGNTWLEYIDSLAWNCS